MCINTHIRVNILRIHPLHKFIEMYVYTYISSIIIPNIHINTNVHFCMPTSCLGVHLRISTRK